MKQETESAFVYLVMIFTALAFLLEFGIYNAPVNFFLFAMLLALFSIPFAKGHRIKDEGVRNAGIILLILIAFAFFLRAVPFPDVPPGYDTGFYKYAIEVYSEDISDQGMPEWIKSMFPQGLFVLLAVLGSILGVGSEWMLSHVFPFLGAMLALPVFLVSRHYFGSRAGILSAAIYAVSYTQYHVFLMMYFKTVLGLILLLFAVYFLEKKKYLLLAIMFAALGAYHRPEFLLMTLVLAASLIFTRDYRLILVALFSFALVYPFWQDRLDIYLPLAFGLAETALSGGTGGGTFYGLFSYKLFASAYMPFAFIGILYVLFRRKPTPLLMLLFINAAIVVFELFFFRRLIVNLDLLLIVFAGAGISAVFLDYKKIPKILGYAAVALLLVVLFSVTVKSASDFGQTIDAGQLKDIRAFDAAPGSFVLAPSTEAPWVLGYTRFEKNYSVISPGLFGDEGTSEEWRALFVESTNATYLERFGTPLYVFHKEKFGRQEKFDSSCFREFSPSFVEYTC